MKGIFFLFLAYLFVVSCGMDKRDTSQTTNEKLTTIQSGDTTIQIVGSKTFSVQYYNGSGPFGLKITKFIDGKDTFYIASNAQDDIHMVKK